MNTTSSRTYRLFLYSALIFIPAVSFAMLGGVKDLLLGAQGLINILIPVFFGVAVLFFFWGMGQFILKDAGNEKTRDDGKKKMLWGIIALFVMVSIYGILQFIGGAIGIKVNTGGSTAGQDLNL